MFLNRIFILVLICCVTVREDFPSLLTSVPDIYPFNVSIHPDSEGLEDVDCVALDDLSELLNGGIPARDDLPPDDREIPGILEIDLDPETEETLTQGDHKAQLGFVGHCLFHEDNFISFASFTSFCALKRIRT